MKKKIFFWFIFAAHRIGIWFYTNVVGTVCENIWILHKWENIWKREYTLSFVSTAMVKKLKMHEQVIQQCQNLLKAVFNKPMKDANEKKIKKLETEKLKLSLEANTQNKQVAFQIQINRNQKKGFEEFLVNGF